MQRYREPQVLFFPVSLLLIFVIFIFCMDFVLPESLLLSIVLAYTMFLKKIQNIASNLLPSAACRAEKRPVAEREQEMGWVHRVTVLLWGARAL